MPERAVVDDPPELAFLKSLSAWPLFVLFVRDWLRRNDDSYLVDEWMDDMGIPHDTEDLL